MRRSAILLFATTLSRALNVPDRRVLSGALAQAASRQARVRAALEHELAGAGALPPAASAASLEKQRRRAELIPLRLAEVQRAEGRIRVFEARLGMDEDLAELRAEIEADEDLGPILRDHDPVAHARTREPRGRPAGFDGLVLESPRGVPVLVGRQIQNKHRVGTRNASKTALDLACQEANRHERPHRSDACGQQVRRVSARNPSIRPGAWKPKVPPRLRGGVWVDVTADDLAAAPSPTSTPTWTYGSTWSSN